MQNVQVREHPLRPEVRRLGLTHWQLRRLLGGRPAESVLSRMLFGVQPMPEEIEEKLRQVLTEVEAGS